MLGGSHCPETFTGRTAIAPQLEADVQQHDISLCNIIGLGADYIYVPYVNRLYVLVNPLGNVFLVLMSIFIVYLMIVMGHNLQVVLNVNAKAGGAKHNLEKTMKRRRGQARYLHCFCTFCGMTNTLVFCNEKYHFVHRWAVACMASLLLLACFASGTTNVLGTFVTRQDQIVFIVTLLHVTYYCIRIEANVYLGNGHRANPVNPMLAAIAAAVQRVYSSAENPYSQTICFIILTWVLHKISMLNRKTLWTYADLYEDTSLERKRSWWQQVRWWRCVDILADCILVSVMLYAGVMGQASFFVCTMQFIMQKKLMQ